MSFSKISLETALINASSRLSESTFDIITEKLFLSLQEAHESRGVIRGELLDDFAIDDIIEAININDKLLNVEESSRQTADDQDFILSVQALSSVIGDDMSEDLMEEAGVNNPSEKHSADNTFSLKNKAYLKTQFLDSMNTLSDNNLQQKSINDVFNAIDNLSDEGISHYKHSLENIKYGEEFFDAEGLDEYLLDASNPDSLVVLDRTTNIIDSMNKEILKKQELDLAREVSISNLLSILDRYDVKHEKTEIESSLNSVSDSDWINYSYGDAIDIASLGVSSFTDKDNQLAIEKNTPVVFKAINNLVSSIEFAEEAYQERERIKSLNDDPNKLIKEDFHSEVSINDRVSCLESDVIKLLEENKELRKIIEKQSNPEVVDFSRDAEMSTTENEESTKDDNAKKNTSSLYKIGMVALPLAAITASGIALLNNPDITIQAAEYGVDVVANVPSLLTSAIDSASISSVQVFESILRSSGEVFDGLGTMYNSMGTNITDFANSVDILLFDSIELAKTGFVNLSMSALNSGESLVSSGNALFNEHKDIISAVGIAAIVGAFVGHNMNLQPKENNSTHDEGNSVTDIPAMLKI